MKKILLISAMSMLFHVHATSDDKADAQDTQIAPPITISKQQIEEKFISAVNELSKNWHDNERRRYLIPSSTQVDQKMLKECLDYAMSLEKDYEHLKGFPLEKFITYASDLTFGIENDGDRKDIISSLLNVNSKNWKAFFECEDKLTLGMGSSEYRKFIVKHLSAVAPRYLNDLVSYVKTISTQPHYSNDDEKPAHVLLEIEPENWKRVVPSLVYVADQERVKFAKYVVNATKDVTDEELRERIIFHLAHFYQPGHRQDMLSLFLSFDPEKLKKLFTIERTLLDGMDDYQVRSFSSILLKMDTTLWESFITQAGSLTKEMKDPKNRASAIYSLSKVNPSKVNPFYYKLFCLNSPQHNRLCFDEFASDVKRLTQNIQDEENLARIISSLSGMGLAHRKEFVDQALFLTMGMEEQENCKSVISSLLKFDVKKRKKLVDHVKTLTAGMENEENRKDVVLLLSSVVDPAYWDKFVTKISLLTKNMKNEENRVRAISSLASIDSDDWNDFFKYVEILTSRMTDETCFSYAMSSLALIDSTYWEEFVNQALSLTKGIKDEKNQKEIIWSLAHVLQSHSKKFIEVEKNITRGMQNEVHITNIISSLSALVSSKELEIFERLVNSLSADMKEEENRKWVVSYLSTIIQKDREAFVKSALMIAKDVKNETRRKELFSVFVKAKTENWKALVEKAIHDQEISKMSENAYVSHVIDLANSGDF